MTYDLTAAEERHLDHLYDAHQDRLAQEADDMDALAAELGEAPPEPEPTVVELLEVATGLNGATLLDALNDVGLTVTRGAP